MITGGVKNSLIVFYNLETLLMLFDGQFYPIYNVFENGQKVTHSMQMRTLASFKSADFMIDSGNILVGYEDVLSAALFGKWFCLREELDLIHKMVLYCLSSADIPVDIKCAFMIEAFLGTGELIDKKATNFSLPSIGKRESKLGKYLVAIIECYGKVVFQEECNESKEQFAKILRDSRNRIAHIKENQGRCYLNGEESVLYLMKLSLIYRVILLDLLEVPETHYRNALNLRTKALNEWNGILNTFLPKIKLV